jgi:meiotically up-regulated gene 157 (Mug157) protein
MREQVCRGADADVVQVQQTLAERELGCTSATQFLLLADATWRAEQSTQVMDLHIRHSLLVCQATKIVEGGAPPW